MGQKYTQYQIGNVQGKLPELTGKKKRKEKKKKEIPPKNPFKWREVLMAEKK